MLVLTILLGLPLARGGPGTAALRSPGRLGHLRGGLRRGRHDIAPEDLRGARHAVDPDRPQIITLGSGDVWPWSAGLFQVLFLGFTAVAILVPYPAARTRDAGHDPRRRLRLPAHRRDLRLPLQHASRWSAAGLIPRGREDAESAPECPSPARPASRADLLQLHHAHDRGLRRHPARRAHRPGPRRARSPRSARSSWPRSWPSWSATTWPSGRRTGRQESGSKHPAGDPVRVTAVAVGAIQEYGISHR